MKKWIGILLCISLLLTGCSSWMDGEYHSVTPYTGGGIREEKEITAVTSYDDICAALEDMVQSAVERGTLSVEYYDANRLESSMALAIRHITSSFPLGVYAVDSVSYELGTSRGVPAIAVTIRYNYNRSTIPKIRQVSTEKALRSLMTSALNRCEPSLVMYVTQDMGLDYVQFVRDYALDTPSQVMELPQVTVNQYPETGSSRVVELQFTYQNSRESLQSMQSYVQPVFSSAALYVSGENEEQTKFDLLYSFLMERNTYTLETSLTPAYSLLRHGVGDSRAFASVYAAMCRRAGLDCQIVNGTKDGNPWFWNIIRQDGIYRHVDLLGAYQADRYQPRTDDQMQGYVWDYSAYPACTLAEEAASGEG